MRSRYHFVFDELEKRRCVNGPHKYPLPTRKHEKRQIRNASDFTASVFRRVGDPQYDGFHQLLFARRTIEHRLDHGGRFAR